MSTVQDANDLIVRLLRMVKTSEWETRHAAENRWCPHCPNDPAGDSFTDQTEHRAGCEFVAVVQAAEAFLQQESAAIQPSALAKMFHEAYERLAPSFGYETRKESAKPWESAPERNKALMTAVCAELLAGRTRRSSAPLEIRLGDI